MIEMTVSSETLKVMIPVEIRVEAHLRLQEIWRDEFIDRANFVMELSESVKAFIEKVKLDRNNILVYR